MEINIWTISDTLLFISSTLLFYYMIFSKKRRYILFGILSISLGVYMFYYFYCRYFTLIDPTNLSLVALGLIFSMFYFVMIIIVIMRISNILLEAFSILPTIDIIFAPLLNKLENIIPNLNFMIALILAILIFAGIKQSPISLDTLSRVVEYMFLIAQLVSITVGTYILQKQIKRGYEMRKRKKQDLFGNEKFKNKR